MSTTQTFEIDSVEVVYTAQKFGGTSAPHDHFELYSEFISETGYQSHFEPSPSVINSGGPESVARDLVTYYWQAPDKQLSLPL